MKTTREPIRLLSQILPALCVVFLVWTGLGCQTFQAINWDERVGSYRVDDAKTELGMPDQTEETADGGTVATWHYRSARKTPDFHTGSSYNSRMDNQTGIPKSPWVSQSSMESSLQLSFDENGILRSWESTIK